MNPLISTGHIDIDVNANLELVNKICYVSGMLSVDRDADAGVETGIRIVLWLSGFCPGQPG